MLKKYLLLIPALSFIVLLALTVRPVQVNAGLNDNVRGWAWSDTIGWISLNSCDTLGTCGAISYGVKYSTTTREFSGYAWSDNIGWVNFGKDVLGTGDGQNGANGGLRMDPSGNTISGWARACAGTSTGLCSTTTSRTDGWDGWIKVISLNKTSPQLFNGWLWGDVNVGWVQAIDWSILRRLTVNKGGTGKGLVAGSMINCDDNCLSATNLYDHNYAEPLSATPAEGAKFEGWGGACSGMNLNCVVTMNADKTVVANFSFVQLTAVIAGGSGMVTSDVVSKSDPIEKLNCPNVCSKYFGWYDTVTLFANANTGYRVKAWSASSPCLKGGGQEQYCEIYLDEAKTATVTFEASPDNAAELRVEVQGNGTVSGTGVSCTSNPVTNPDGCSEIYPKGTSVTLTQAPTAGNTFVGWFVDGGSLGSCPTSGNCTVTMNSARYVRALFQTGGSPSNSVSADVKVRECTEVTNGKCVTSNAFSDGPIDVVFEKWYEVKYDGSGPRFTQCTGINELTGLTQGCLGTILRQSLSSAASAKTYGLQVKNPSTVPTSVSDTAIVNELPCGSSTICAVCYATPTTDPTHKAIIPRGLRQPITWVVSVSGGNGGGGNYTYKWNGTDTNGDVISASTGSNDQFSVNNGNGYQTVGLKTMTVEVHRGNDKPIITCTNKVKVTANPIYEEF